MNLSQLKSGSDFSAAVVPPGMVLIFYTTDEKGNLVKQYKDSNGNYGSM